MHARPSSTVSVISEIARATFPAGSPGAFIYYLVQGLTFAILVLAANTSYQGFPRLAAILARDRFFPRQFVNLGDRLVYSNGIVVLAGVASLLIWVFNANVNSLIHLYVIGVFTAFTLSQAGMVRYWRRLRTPGWRRSAVINGAGAVATGGRRAARRPDEVPRRAPGRSPSRSRCSSAASTASTATTARSARRLRAGAGGGRGRAAGDERGRPLRRLLRPPRCARRVWYARQIAGDDFRAIHVPGGAQRHRASGRASGS